MKKFVLLVITVFSTLSIFATDISGEWIGKRYQFDRSQQKYVEEFHYKYDLEQDEEGFVKGTVIITNLEGYYAEMKLKGFVEGETFHFEEHEIIDATRPENTIWCFKKGELKISKGENGTTLSGKTASFMEQYGLPCSGGYTFLSKDYEYVDDEVVKEDNVEISEELSLEIFPNPFTSFVNIKFDVQETSRVVLDVVNVKGDIIENITNETLESGTHTYKFTPNETLQELIYYVRLRIGDKVFSKAIQKSNRGENNLK